MTERKSFPSFSGIYDDGHQGPSPVIYDPAQLGSLMGARNELRSDQSGILIGELFLPRSRRLTGRFGYAETTCQDDGCLIAATLISGKRQRASARPQR
jgi:hypothetical protein